MSSCDDVDDLAEEFALGLLDGAERAVVVAHLEDCRSCGARVADLAEVGEQLLLVSPVIEPPAGFEQRVLAQLAPLAPQVTRRHRRGPGTTLGTALAIAAAVALVLGTAGLVLLYSDHGSSTVAGPSVTEPPVEATATMLSVHGARDVGDVVLVDDEPMVVELDMAEWMDDVGGWEVPPTGPWTLAVERTDGAVEEHSLALTDDPTPRVTLARGSTPVRSVSIADGTGHVWCSAQFG